MAEATDTTIPTRRLFVTGASAAAVLVAVPAAAGGSDAALIALVDLYFDVAKTHARVEAYADRLLGLFYAREPAKPQALRYRHISDPAQIGWKMEHLPNTKCRTWCDEGDIEKLRGVPITRRIFNGTGEPDVDRAMPEEALWSEVPCPILQRRYDEILAAHDAHKAAVQSIRDDLGLDAIEAVVDELALKLDEMTAEIISTKAATREGLRAKARVVFDGMWLDDERWNDDRYDTTDARIMASIVRDLMDVAPRAAA
jgi:hypothetical protein